MANRRGRVPPEVTREREKKAWEFRQQLWSHARIAAELDISESAVSKLLRRVNSRIKKETEGQAAEHRQEQIRQLQRIADESMQAWERSKQAERTVIMTKPDGGKETKIVKMKDADGDPRFLNTARDALGDLRRIMGLDAPTKTAFTDASGMQDAMAISQEERLTRLEALLRLARERKDDKERRKDQKNKPGPLEVVLVEPDEKAEIVQ